MSNATSLGLWVLLTVTYDGNVSTSSLPTKAACEDAASIVITGKTVAEKKEWDAALYAAEKKGADEWQSAHPPRKPKDKYEEDFIASVKKDRAAGVLDSPRITCDGTGGSAVTICESRSVTVDFLIQDLPPPRGGGGGSVSYYSMKDIKVAKCFLSDPPTNPDEREAR